MHYIQCLNGMSYNIDKIGRFCRPADKIDQDQQKLAMCQQISANFTSRSTLAPIKSANFLQQILFALATIVLVYKLQAVNYLHHLLFCNSHFGSLYAEQIMRVTFLQSTVMYS